MEESVEQAAGSSLQYSEYGSSEFPDAFIDGETPEDMIVDPRSD